VHERPPAPADFVPATVRPEAVPANARGVVNLASAGWQQEVNPDFGLPDGERWAGDIVVTTFSYDQVEPSMERAPDGSLFLAVEEHGSQDGWIRVWKSVDDGKHWDWMVGFKDAGGSRNPALTVAQNAAGQDYVYVAYYAPGRNAIGVYKAPTSGGFGTFLDVATGLTATDVYPRICTDNSLWQTYYIYVTWTDNYIDYYPALFSRSLDYGATWSAVTNLTGGSENSSWVTQPDNAFGTAGLFVCLREAGVERQRVAQRDLGYTEHQLRVFVEYAGASIVRVTAGVRACGRRCGRRERGSRGVHADLLDGHRHPLRVLDRQRDELEHEPQPALDLGQREGRRRGRQYRRRRQVPRGLLARV
jgi:hypothetical protein